MGASWALTARGAELERLGRAFADDAVGGVLLTGPAGVGKTRLGEEALRAAGDRPTARAVGHAATRAIPLGALAHLLPPDLVRDVGVEGEDRARLFHLGRLSVAELAGEERLLLLLDDIDQLDDTSLALLVPLMVDRVVFLIATLRSGQRLPDVVTSFVKDGHLELRELPPLEDDEVATLLHRVLDGPIDAPSVERLAAISQGNLQVLREVVRRAEESGALHREEGVWHLTGLPIPARLEDLIEAHLGEADDLEREVLEVLAIAGSAGVADLEEILDRRRLETLEERGFIQVTVDGRRVRAALAHPLYGEVLRQQISPLRELRMKRRLADRIEGHGARRREDVTQLAVWRLEAGGDVDPEVLLGAGRLALVGRDAAMATRFARAAADLGARHDAARISVEAALLTADLRGAERAVEEVWDDPELPDEHRAHLCRRLVAARFARIDLDGALRAVEDAAALITDRDALDLVLAQLALLHAHNGLPLEAMAVLEEVPDTGDPRLRSELLSARSQSETMLGRFDAAAASARAGASAERELPAWLARGSNARHVVNEAHAYAYGGRFDAARDIIGTAIASARASGAEATTGWFELVLGQLERDAGDGRTALVHFQRAIDLAIGSGQDGAMVWALLGLAQGHLLLGDVAAGAAALDRADAAGHSPLAGASALRARARSWLLAARGDLAGARALGEGAADEMRTDSFLISEAWLRHDIVRFGAPEDAVDRLTELAEVMDGPFVHIAADHARAAAGRDRDAYGAVVDRYETAGFLVAAAEAAAEAAELHRRQGDPRAATAAEQRAARLVERTGARTPGLQRGSGVEPLTAREREVALLAASGASSKDIAAQLYLSARTVDTHLARAYRKLGITGRDELGDALEMPTS